MTVSKPFVSPDPGELTRSSPLLPFQRSLLWAARAQCTGPQLWCKPKQLWINDPSHHTMAPRTTGDEDNTTSARAAYVSVRLTYAWNSTYKVVGCINQVWAERPGLAKPNRESTSSRPSKWYSSESFEKDSSRRAREEGRSLVSGFLHLGPVNF